MELGSLLKNRYKVQKELSKSSSARVFKVLDLKRSKTLALKCYSSDQKFFQSEFDAYSALHQLNHFPKLHSSGLSGTGSYIMMSLLKEPVKNCIESSNFSFSVILDISFQLICRLEAMHSVSFVHRNLSPSNLMTGFDEARLVIYLIDFARCKKFRDPASKIHHKYSEGHSTSGNLRFSSVNAMRGIDYSRRDDIESWFYITAYLITMKLPWDSEVKHGLIDKVLKTKTGIPCEKICKGLPSQFMQIFTYVKALRFEENPDYCFLKKMILDAEACINSQFLCSLSSNKSVNQIGSNKNKRSGSQSAHVTFLDFDSLQCTLNFQSTKLTKSFNGTPKKQRKRKLRSNDRNSTIKGDLPEFKNRQKIFNDKIEISELSSSN
jgi:serine/threonine protein kinase